MSVIELLTLNKKSRTPVIRQTEASECGLACLAMVAHYYGLEVSMPTLRRHFGVSLRGATLKTLMQMAENVALSTRAIRCDVAELADVKCPAILHWNLNHFVVLTGVKRAWSGFRYIINDPASGAYTLNEAELSRKFTGVVLELSKASHFKDQRVKSSLKIRQLWSGIHGATGALIGILTLSVILQFIALVMPFYLQLCIDTVLPASDEKLLRMLAIGFCGLAIISMLTSWLRSLSLINMTNAFSFQVTNNLYRHLISLSLSWFDKRHVGDIISRFTSIQPITDFISQGLVSTVIDGGMAFVTLILMFIYSPLLASIAFAAWIIYVLLRVGSFQVIRGANINTIAAVSKENTAFIETIRGISTVKAFGQEASRQRTWQTLKASAVNSQLKQGRITAGFDSLSGFVISIERVIFVYIAIRSAIDGSFTAGMIFAFQAYKQQFLDAATRLVDQGLKYRLMDVHLTRIADIALSKVEPLGVRPDQIHSIKGGIELRGVSFRYGVSDPEVLSDINLYVAPGEMVAFVGPSGGGKTTLLKIMMGLLEPSAGIVLIDGQPLEHIGMRAWRSRIGSVLQDDQLFAGSLAENIAFFEHEIDMDRVRLACEQAAILSEIEAMPLGLETLVGDMGSSLSGGQRQRVMLARALYAQPVVLLMDEGTANLDPVTEERVVDTLKHCTATRLISAHRPLAINAAARVFLVRDGKATPLQRR